MGCSPNIYFQNKRLYLCPRRPCSLKWWHTTGHKYPVVCCTMLGCVHVGSVVWRVTRVVVRDTDRNPCTTYASTDDNQPLFYIDVDQRLFFPITRYMSLLTKKSLVKFHCTCFHRVQCYCLLKPRVKSIHRKLEMATCIGFPGQEE